jgi:LPXTG-motif cell wall-anchored protein
VGQHRANGMVMTITAVAGPAALPATGGAALPLGLAGAGLASALAGIVLRRRTA